MFYWTKVSTDTFVLVRAMRDILSIRPIKSL